MAKTNRNAQEESKALTRANEEEQGKAVPKTQLPKIIYFDDKENDVERKEFSRDHALRLVALQHKHSYKNWTISDGQNLQIKDGKIISGSDTGATEESDA